jgi:hypothetical protein
VKKLILVTILALSAVLGYHLVKDPQMVKGWFSPAREVISELRTIRRGILSSLNTQAPDPTPEINRILAAAGSKNPPSEEQRLTVQVCRRLKSALAERERYGARLNQVRTKRYDGIAPGSAAEKRKLYEADVTRKWDAYVQRTRSETEKLLTRLQSL